MNDNHFTDAAQLVTTREERLTQDMPDSTHQTDEMFDGYSQISFNVIVAMHELMGIALFLRDDLCENLIEEVEFLIRKYR